MTQRRCNRSREAAHDPDVIGLLLRDGEIYRNFVMWFAKIAPPLHGKIGINERFEFQFRTDAELDALEELKTCLLSQLTIAATCDGRK